MVRYQFPGKLTDQRVFVFSALRLFRGYGEILYSTFTVPVSRTEFPFTGSRKTVSVVKFSRKNSIAVINATGFY